MEKKVILHTVFEYKNKIENTHWKFYWILTAYARGE